MAMIGASATNSGASSFWARMSRPRSTAMAPIVAMAVSDRSD